MSALKGLMTINGVDPYEQYGAFLFEDQPSDNRNYSSLLKPPAVKPQKEVSYREQDGASLPAVILQKWQPRYITLMFAIVASSPSDFFAKYNAFVSALKNGNDGWLDICILELGRHFMLVYQECSDYKQITDFDSDVVCKFYIKFREPNPVF